ncbi:MAG TPA: RagB/SusD family nutrient uptake outer membrane protein [Chitinophagaceae bacterium]|nr:RagB/SusD family nutrient uptake outer membrane protein [Chitinophagaceae bacterium]
MKTTYLLLLVGSLLSLASCKKFLDEKPDRSLVVPENVKDLQALLDNTNIFNADYPYALDIGADDYFLKTADWLARSASEKNGYIWEKDVFNDNPNNPWSISYVIVYNSNVVLDQLKKLGTSAGTQEGINNIKGQALFFRSFAFYNLLQVFAKPYSVDSAALQWGIALRLDADLNKPTTRATVKQSYDQLIADTKEASTLLPDFPALKTRPSKQAAFALLARTYLSMSDYENALLYADSALKLYNTLLDYNTLNPAATRPVPQFNAECIFHSVYVTTNTLNILAKVDSALFSSYDANDLRRSVFFKNNGDGTYSFKGSYDGSARSFNGFAIDEMYLTRAECFARAGNTSAAMNDLNALLVKRWKTGTFIPFTASDANQALAEILTERRKELLMRGIRWSDLRRLNKEPQFSKTLVRFEDNQIYYLYPNDPRYVFPIPLLIIQMTGIPQNDR